MIMCRHRLVCFRTDNIQKSTLNAYYSIYCDVYLCETLSYRRFKATVFALCPRAV